MEKKYNIAVVGATGAVGLEMLRMLAERGFPVASVRALASARSPGRRVPFGAESIAVEALTPESARGVELALFSAGATISKEYAPIFVKAGAVVIDNSSAWRMDPQIPLVVPEVNPRAVSAKTRLIANPNCSTIQMVVALQPLHKAATLRRVVVSTYQSTSGAGAQGMEELTLQTRAVLAGTLVPEARKHAARIAFNVIPQIDVFVDNGYTKEEMKMTYETRKIMGLPKLPLSATTVRVPVFRAHSEAVWAEFKKPLSAAKARQLLAKAPGVVVIDEPEKKRYPLALDASGKTETFVGRIRQDISTKNGLVFWVVADNLLKGAASNAVQIAELMAKGVHLKRLVVNADDLGRSASINQGIIEGHQKGIVTSASLMTTGAAFEEAVCLAKANPKLGIGLHLDLDSFFEVEHGVGRLKSYKDPSLPLMAIAEATESQIRKALDTGLSITHLDGHHHAHLRPELFATIAALTAKHKIKFIRFFKGFYDGLYPGIGIEWIPDLVRRFGLRQVDTFFAGWEPVTSSLPGYRYFDPAESFELAELMVHPGKGEAWREKELEHCITAKALLEKNQIQPVRFDEAG